MCDESIMVIHVHAHESHTEIIPNSASFSPSENGLPCHQHRHPHHHNMFANEGGAWAYLWDMSALRKHEITILRTLELQPNVCYS